MERIRRITRWTAYEDYDSPMLSGWMAVSLDWDWRDGDTPAEALAAWGVEAPELAAGLLTLGTEVDRIDDHWMALGKQGWCHAGTPLEAVQKALRNEAL